MFDLKTDRPDDETLLARLIGPTGNLRAPTARVGTTLLVGFNQDAYAQVLGRLTFLHPRPSPRVRYNPSTSLGILPVEGSRMTTGRNALAAVIAARRAAGRTRPRPGREGGQSAVPEYAVEKHADIAYRTDKDADKERHKLDVYVPEGARRTSRSLFFVHGGSWRCGQQEPVRRARRVVRRGRHRVRSSSTTGSRPQVQHPAHVEDVAKAFAWTCENIGKYGGDAGAAVPLRPLGRRAPRLAAGHRPELPEGREAHRRPTSAGVVAISGVYQIVHDVPVFDPAFGKDEEVCKQASPLTHVTGKHPPFLIAYADNDFRRLDEMARTCTRR